MATCKWCKGTCGRYPRNNGTSAMKTHWKSVCKKYPDMLQNDLRKQKILSWEARKEGEDGVGTIKIAAYDPAEIRKKIFF